MPGKALFILLGGLLALPLHAEQAVRQVPAPGIQRIYVSPGASGSIESSSSSQGYDGYGGAQVPRRYEQGSSTVIIDSSGGNGGIRQSIEYPNGVAYPVNPGTRSSSQRQSYP
ncbi:hypothetical protein [Pseudomonas panipatensis]|jgi:hypothetical protein|uniref:Uncharacterized protein n=1 Tax=Pseudomonas panipatensis TaxID=428992 RepID=A0A1G8I753_9PSED|nr:hypothetical protein [Pseudomonas panipatensis]SDI14795.1 hypothetical protein SAMN05216272_10676 [Pseudomonas panipatensis]SMP75869.1 hypothetical protein SAMN06295951_11436 [Pseudomonas panipatensis]